MNSNDKINETEQSLTQVDNLLTELFEKRLELAAGSGQNKLNTAQERNIINRVTKNQNDELAGYTKILFNTLFELSKSYQSRELFLNSPLAVRINEALETTPKLFPKSAVVACQGIEGSNSQDACERLFSRPNIMYFNSFEAVFSAVEKGLCKYGILPIENNLQGSVRQVYDLMKEYKFYIAKSIKLKIEHVLLGNKKTDISKIKEIYSHEQALAQCSHFIKGLGDVKIIPMGNTATAAKYVSNSQSEDIAAIATKNCIDLYDLSALKYDIQNSENNYTRFICISKDMEIYPGSNKISLMFAIPHKPGSLNNIISKFSALDINLTKLESRPLAGKDFEFMFHVDFDAELYSKEILNLICQLENDPEFFAFLGNYSEI